MISKRGLVVTAILLVGCFAATSGAQIRNIIFDMGEVITEKKGKSAIDKESEAKLKSVAWHDWERGKITKNECIDRTASLFDRKDVEKLAAWSLAEKELIAVSVEAIRKLKMAGYKLYLISNNKREVIAAFKEQKMPVNIFTFFDGVIFSFEEGYIKPEPEIYEILLERYGLIPHECLFIDDTRVNVEAAKKSGMQGFIFTKKTFPDELKKYLPDLK